MIRYRKMFNVLLFQPILNFLILFYHLTGNLGLAIVAMTLLIKLVLYPLTRPASKTAVKMKEVQQKIQILKEKYAASPRRLQEEQLKIYREHGINPAAGCLPQLIQLVALIGLFQVFNNLLSPTQNPVELINRQVYLPLLKLPQDAVINTTFFYLNLAKPDLINLPFSVKLGSFDISQLPGVFLIGAAALQFISSKMMMPVVKSEKELAKKTKEKSDDFATMMQEQMLYAFPLMTLLIGIRFPSGLVLYWLTFSALAIVEQYRRAGWGNLEPIVAKFKPNKD